MADNTIDSLSIEISSNASGASRSITNLCNRLERLDRTTFSGIKNLKRYSRQMNELNKAARKLNSVKFNNKLFNLKSPNLSNFLANIKNVGNSSQRAMPQVKNFSKNLSSIESNAKKGSSGLSKLLSNIEKMLALKISFSGFKDMFEKSSELLEDFNFFDQAFKQVADKAGKSWSEAGFSSAEEYANSFSKRARELTSKMSGFDISDTGVLTANKSGLSLGMDPSTLLNAQATFAQISSSMGTTSEQAANLSDALTMLGADLASLRNEDFSKVYDNLTSGLTGMSRAVDKYGINIRVANLQQEATNLGIQTSVSNMSQADKVLLRTIVMLESSKSAWTDLSRSISLPANQLRIFKNNLAMISRLLGNIFLPIVAKALPYINGLAIAFQRLLMGIGNLTGANKQIGQMYGGITKGSDVLSDALDAVDDTDLSGLNDTTADADDNLKSAAKNAKKLKQFLASYDELEVMSKNDDSSTSLGSTKLKVPAVDTSALDSSILNDKLNSLLGEYQKQWDKAYNSMENKAMVFANKVTDAFKKLAKAAEPTTKALKNLWNNGLKQLRDFTWTALKDFWNHFLVPLGKWTLGEKGLPRLINAFNDFLVKINWDKINASLVKLWDALEPFAENVGTGLLNFFDDFFDKAADGVNKLPGMIDKITAFIKGISPEQAQDIGYKLGQLFSVLGGIKLLKGTIGILDKLGVGKFLTMLASHPLLALAGGLGAILLKLDSMGKIHIPWESIKNGFETLKEKIMELVEKIPWDDLDEMFTNFIESIKPIGEGVIEGLGDVLKGIGSGIKTLYDKLEGMTPDELENIGKALGTIIGIKIAADLAQKITGLGNAYTTLGNGLSVLKTGLIGIIALAGFKGGEWISKNLLGGEDTTLGDFVNDIMGYEAGDVSNAINAWLDDVSKKIHPSSLTEDDIKLFDDWKTAVFEMINAGEVSAEQGQKLNKYIEAIKNSGEGGNIALWDLQNRMMDLGISFDSFNQYLDGTKESMNSVGDSTKTAAERIEESSRLIDSVSFSNIEKNLDNLKSTADKVDYAELVVKTSNAIDQMGGIWENGKQILGEKALQIYQQISKGLQPDENGFYKIGEDQMVQFGNGIENYKETLKGKTKETLDESLQHVLTWGIPSAYSLGQGEAGYYIEGFNSSIVSLSPDLQAAFNAMYDGISTKEIEDKAETSGKTIAEQSGKGFSKGMEENSQTVKDATNKMIDDNVKTPAQDSLGIHSPSKWFENLAKFCGSGFENGLDTGFDGAFTWFEGLRAKINNSIGSLHSVGWNAIIGMNNGMVEAATQHLYKNAQTIAENVANKIRSALKINSPSRVMAEIGGFTVEGFQLGMQNMLPKVESTINDISAEVQKINTPTADIITNSTSYQEVRSRMSVDTDDFVDDIRKEVMAISSNTFDNNQMIGQAVKNALNGMAIYADGHLIGYLQEEDRQYRNRSGVGLFEG